ncbi:hypothetical protein C3B58_12795 [Lactonifactor longoviformis]|uniref:Uncharacterized protein n=1 Tax=Lactonifactor longoviformis DSM 17459 TaxID=1122155 RepID=A0A1M5D5N3_9CLOT|nr:hypothetical protein [Lactonifactor longoviformis]POP32275.1 hypothetical protein C3B58_12795 [Lactonifactor longoviformis]SHF62383.1 hypothetical protein SAMN02745158_04428 [Lactonifactor longoviformis DSM 17459]
MKLYRFYIDAGKLQKEILDVEEKPKSYTITGCDWRKRIAKDDIGAVDCRKRVHLLEDDKKKAIDILMDYYSDEKCRHDRYHEEQIKRFHEIFNALHIAGKEATNE